MVKGIFAPFVLGAGLAFILNVPMRAYEGHLKNIKNDNFRRLVAVVLTLVSVCLVLALVFVLLIPQLVSTIQSLVPSLIEFVGKVEEYFNKFLSENPQLMEWVINNTDFENIDWASFIQQAMTRYKVDPSWINLEITETADANTRQVVLSNMDILRQQGITFSLDDFGTGRSNLDYIVNMPVQIIKFDYQFTHWYFGDEKARNVVEGTASIIRNMGLPIVAEGVENEEQLEAMIRLGASYIQGFYFSKPLQKDVFVEFMRKQQM
jgi:EAL domain-containing protein (putative c-di-GMP-specific phosphodiesterase class I)